VGKNGLESRASSDSLAPGSSAEDEGRIVMRHRLLVASLVLLLTLTAALPAGGKPPPPPSGTATATITHNGGCSVTVTYSWSGFSGRNLVAQFGVRWPGEWGIVFGINTQRYPVTGSGSATNTFDLTGHGEHAFYGGGQLLTTKGKTVGGSAARSSTPDLSLSCPQPEL
jgi:hypothetical protein